MFTKDSSKSIDIQRGGDSHLRNLSAGLCWTVGSIALIFIVFWFAGSESRAFVGMNIKVNACFCLLFLAVSLSLRRTEPIAWWKNIVSNILSSLVILTSCLTILEYTFGWDLIIDQLFGFDNSTVSQFQAPGRMAPNAVVCFLFLGISIVFIDGKKWGNKLAQRLAVVSGMISLIALIGHMYQATALYQILSFQKFVPLAAVGSLILSVAIFLMRPQNSIIRKLSNETSVGFFARRLLIAAVSIPLFFGWVGWAAAQYHLIDKTLSFAAVAASCMFFLVTLVWRSVVAMNETDQERLKIAGNLATERSRLAAIIDNLPAGVVIGEVPSGNIILTNNYVREVLKFPFLDAPGTSTFDLDLEGYYSDGSSIGKDDWPLSRAIRHGVISKNQEMLLRCGDGKLRMVSTYCSPIYSDTGQIQAAVLLIFEITAKKREEDWTHFVATSSQLVTSTLDDEKTFQEMVASAVPALADFCFVDILGANGVSRRMAWKHADLKIQGGLDTLFENNPTDLFLSPSAKSTILDGKSLFIKNYSDQQPKEQILSETTDALIKELDLKSVITVPLGSKNTMIAALTFCMTSFSGRRFEDVDFENAKEFSGYLTIALENIILYRQSLKSMEAAEEASAAKTRFLANMSHEIRTPLGAITGFLELMKNSVDSNPEMTHYMSVINRNSQQLLSLIDDILDLSKVEAGKMTVEKIEFSVVDLIKDLASIFGFRAEEKGIGFKITLETPLPNKIISDPVRLRQILSNILGNAVKFTKSGQVDLLIQYQNEVLNFTVKDSGPGIGADQVAHLFQPFSQADPSTTRVFGGTGLGLVLSRRLARLLGGNVELKASQLGQGSTFVVTVEAPLSSKSSFVNSDEINKFAPTKESRPVELAQLHNIKVLVVEDSPDNQVLLSIFLKRAGATVDLANNGIEGVEKAQSGNFDVILMDIQMPKMDGYAAMRMLRSRGYEKPIIALTAHAMQEERDLCFAAGCTKHMAKPVNRELLLEMISTLVPAPNRSASLQPNGFILR